MAGKSDIVKGALDLTAKLLGEGGEQAAKTGIRAYHGSPHSFDKFDISKIGTGEGAQAYGHGIDVSENPSVAEAYRTAGSSGNMPSAPDETIPDVLSGDAENFRQLSVSDPAFIKDFGGIDVKRRGDMLPVMRGLLQNSEIANSVVGLIPVDVMHMLGGKEITPQMLRHNPSMLVNLLPIDTDYSVSGGIKAVDILAPYVARAIAKHSLTGADFVGVSDYSRAASGTGEGRFHNFSKITEPSSNGNMYEGSINAHKASIPNKAYGGCVDDDIDDAIRIAKDVGGSTPVMMEDAKGNKYDAQGNVIPPTNPGPNPARSNVTPEAVAAKAVNDPATFDALMERYAVPDRDIAQYEATKKAVAQQPYETQQMTHVGAKPERDVTVDMPLFGGEYSLGRAPYDVAGPMAGMAQTAYDWKTAPFYALPLTAPLAAGMDVAEGVATEDPLTASLAIGFGPGGKYAKAAGIGAANYLMAPEEAEAGPARWFSKAMEVARELPMNKMTGEQALAMLRKSVSPEELKWTGVDRFLPGEETITKQDLIDYLEKNRVGTEDVILGGTDKPSIYGPGSRYGEQYMTPGGTDYRETLITLPTKEYGNLYQSSHWEGVPNVVGHIRTQMLDVTPPGSNRPYKAFNVDEAQSDYAKSGREKGFGIPKEEYNKLEMKADISRENLLRYYESLPDRHRPTSDEIQSDISRMANGRLPVFINPEGSAKPLVDSFMGDYKALEKAANALPTAPYVTSTQNWTDLSIKKALDQALDAGADYFTYTPGEVQAQRYGLSQDLQSIAYDPIGQKLEYMPKTGGWDAVSQKVPPEKLPEYIGKEMAEKLLAQEDVYAGGTGKMKVLEGDDLKLGGHGMRDYYNNIYKKRVEKVVKDATGKKVQWEVIPVQTADGPREQLGFRLTDDMKEARFSDFNKGGRVADPVVNKALALTSGY